MGCTITNKIYTNDYGYAFVRKASTDLTTFTAANTPTLILGTFFEKENVGNLFTTSSGRVTNTSGKTIKVKCSLNVTQQQVGASTAGQFMVAKNGAVDSEQYQEFKATGNKESTTVFAIFELSNGDYVEPYVSTYEPLFPDLRTTTVQFIVEAI